MVSGPDLPMDLPDLGSGPPHSMEMEVICFTTWSRPNRDTSTVVRGRSNTSHQLGDQVRGPQTIKNLVVPSKRHDRQKCLSSMSTGWWCHCDEPHPSHPPIDLMGPDGLRS